MVFYKKVGEGDPLFLLHSGGMSHTEWAPNIQFLQDQFTLYLLDLPGHGQSKMKGEKLSIRECGEAVLWVMEQEGLEKAHLCGSSMGGATALWVAMNHAEKVDRLILYRVNYCKTQDTFGGTRSMGDPEHWVRLGMDKIMSRMHLGQGDEESWKEVITRVGDALNPADSDHGYALSELAKLETRTMVVCGDRDPLVPIDDVLEMYKTIPNSALWVLPEATHITQTNLWRKQIFSEEITRFLTRTRAIL